MLHGLMSVNIPLLVAWCFVLLLIVGISLAGPAGIVMKNCVLEELAESKMQGERELHER